jgi:large subunit ribosomal protein L15
MGTTLSTLAPPSGSRRKPKRKGRGPGSGNGTTAGKGYKGQKCRAGAHIRPGFEGGQMPLQRRLPKRGFKNPFRVEYDPINVSQLAKIFAAGEVVDPEVMKAKGAISRTAKRVKVLGNGEIASGLTIKAHAFSKSALEKIQAAGGTAEVLVIERKPLVKGVKKARKEKNAE